MRKRYVIIAGVNGAGKTTFFSMENTFEKLEVVNLDNVVRTIGSWKNSSDVIKAGKIVVNKIRDFLDKGIPFVQETTLCGRSILNNINKAKELSYFVELCYIGLENPEIAKERVEQRVKNGGHGISNEVIERRYYDSLRNLINILPICDQTAIYDNTSKLERVAFFEAGLCKWTAKNVPEWYRKIILLDTE